jgi:hypothetical protein
MPPASPADRYEPLPGLLGLPRHLFRKLSPRGRRIATVLGVLLLAGAVVGAIVLVPRLAELRRENAAEQRLERQRALAAEQARLRAEQRPRRGRVAPGAAAAAVGGVEAAITRDALARRAAGELATRVKRTDCRTLSRDGARLLLACTAVTSDVAATEDVGGVLIGYPYRGAVTLSTGRYAICKTSGRPGEGSYTQRRHVELPRVCGG